VDSLEVCEFIIVGINTNTKEQAGISPVHDFVVAELDRVSKANT
jgi:hypothetical protein